MFFDVTVYTAESQISGIRMMPCLKLNIKAYIRPDRKKKLQNFCGNITQQIQSYYFKYTSDTWKCADM